MLDRTDLQLMIAKQIMEMDTDNLMELYSQLTGHELEVYDEATEAIIGSAETLDIEDGDSLKKWLGFLLYALGERVANAATESLGE